MTQVPKVRLHLFFATENNRAMILRQGPARDTRMILWHRDTDTFEDGQWLRHKVNVPRSSLSPDGRHFIYFMLDGRWDGPGQGAYTAISRPPYWTALALFPQGDAWGGGGVFLDNRHYLSFGGADIIGRDEELARVALGAAEKGCTTGIRLMNGRPAPLDRKVTRRLLAGPMPSDFLEMWAWLSDSNRTAREEYPTEGGRLFRRSGDRLDLIRDFTDMTFEPVRAPYDWREPQAECAVEPWHPFDGERG
ncbi:MAG: hypothetical protein WBB85_21450 [Albidovulum sp.]|uniref:hypothetical protein n=1 Tax=Albidovulum sp. TaxID=1872424 RepID=UPI003C905730